MGTAQRGHRDETATHIDELIESWTLDDADLALVRNKTGPTRLGFAVLLKFFELEARFPAASTEVPIEAVDFLARQLGIDLAEWEDYDWTGSSWKRHRRHIRIRFGFRGWSMTDVDPLTEDLTATINRTGTDRGRLDEQVYVWCREMKVELPSLAQIDRFVGSAVFCMGKRHRRRCHRSADGQGTHQDRGVV